MNRSPKLLDREQCFEEYYALGDSRTLLLLHKTLKEKYTNERVPAYPTLKEWGHSGEWRKRVGERNIQEAHIIMEQTGKKSASKRSGLIDDVYTALTTGVKDVKINTPQGLKAAVDALTKLEQVDLPHSTTGVKIAFEMVDGRNGQKAAAVAVIQEQKEEANKE